MDNNAELSSQANRVQIALETLGLSCKVIELSDSTRTAQEAAQAAHCELGQIVKSLIFRGKKSGEAILILTSGSNRVDEHLAGIQLGEAIERADADFARQETGFAIGGIPPLAHTKPLRTLIDQDLLQYPTVWAAAGTPHAIFELASADLERVTNGLVCKIAK